MADNKEYIERGALLAMCKRQIECEWNTLASPGTWAHAFEDFSDLVEQTPAADVVEVVRCKDCAYREEFLDRVMCRRTAHKSANGWFGLRATADHHYCSYGERKEQT